MPTAAAPARPSGSYLPELESVRGIAIVLVLLYHAHLLPARLGLGPLSSANPFVRSGHTGVTLFFVLSAFLLARPFLHEARGERTVDRRGFLHRRVLRIVPLYAVCVAVGVLFADGGFGAERLAKGVRALLFLPGLGPTLFPFSVPWWSLTTEAQFYLVLPLVTLLGITQRGRRWLVAIAVAYAVAFVLLCLPWVRRQLPLEPRHWVWFWQSAFGRASTFGVGALAAWIFLSRLAGRRERADAAGPGRRLACDAAILTTLALLAVLLRSVGANYFAMEIRRPWWHLAEAALWSPLLLVVLAGRPFLKPLFVNPVLHRLGVVSYSLYLWHCPVLIFGMRALVAVAPGCLDAGAPYRKGIVLALLPVAWGLAELSYRFIEAPFLQRKNRIR